MFGCHLARKKIDHLAQHGWFKLCSKKVGGKQLIPRLAPEKNDLVELPTRAKDDSEMFPPLYPTSIEKQSPALQDYLLGLPGHGY